MKKVLIRIFFFYLFAVPVFGQGSIFVTLAQGTGTGGSANAVAIQGVPISSSLPGGGNCLQYNGTVWAPGSCAGSGGSGTVTSVSSGNVGSLFTVAIATATTTPAFSFTAQNATGNSVYGNCTGSSAAPSFCSLTAAMLPVATTGAFGAVKPDGTTITISGGVISSTGGGGGMPCTTTALSFQFNNAGAFGCVPDFTFTAPHTMALGASGIFTITGTLGLSGAAGFTLPTSAAFTSSAAVEFGIDSTNFNAHCWNGSVDLICLGILPAAGEVNNDVAGFALSSGNVSIKTLGGSTGGGTSFLKCTPNGLLAGDYFGVSGGICQELVPGLTPVSISASGTTTMLSSYRGELITAASASGAQTFALPDGTATGFTNNFYTKFCNYGTVGALSITNNGGSYTFNGAASPYSLSEGYCADVSNDASGSNWTVTPSPGLLAAGTGLAITHTQFGTSYATSAVPLSSLAAQAANTVVANLTGGSAAPTATTVQGTDTSLLSSGTVSGTGATLCTDSNGGATTSGCSSGSSGVPLLNTNITRSMVAGRSGQTGALNEVVTTTTTGGANNDGAPTTTNPAFNDITTSVAFTTSCANGCVGLQGANLYAARTSGNVYQFQVQFPTNIGTNTGRYFAGLCGNGGACTVAALGSNGSPSTGSLDFVGIRYDTITGDASPQCVFANGSATNVVAPSTGITAAQLNKFEIDDNGTSYTIKNNGTTICSAVSTDIPTSGHQLSFITMVTPHTANAIHTYFYGFMEVGQ